MPEGSTAVTQTLVLASGVVVYGLYYAWKSQRAGCLLQDYRSIPKRQLQPRELGYLKFIIESKNSTGTDTIRALLATCSSILIDSFCFDVHKAAQNRDMSQENSSFLPYITLLHHTRKIFKDFSGPLSAGDARASFFKKWITLFEDEPSNNETEGYLIGRMIQTLDNTLAGCLVRFYSENGGFENALQVLIQTQCINTYMRIQDILQDDPHILGLVRQNPPALAPR